MGQIKNIKLHIVTDIKCKYITSHTNPQNVTTSTIIQQGSVHGLPTWSSKPTRTHILTPHRRCSNQNRHGILPGQTCCLRVQGVQSFCCKGGKEIQQDPCDLG